MKTQILLTAEMSESQLVNALMPLVKRIASQFVRKLPAHIRHDDILSAGMVGLLEALKKFDASRVDSFVGYVALRVRGSMLDELRRGDIMSQEARTLSRRLQKSIADLQTLLGRPPQAAEIASHLGMSEELYLSQLENISQVQLVSIDQQEELMQLIDQNGADPLDEAELNEYRRKLVEAIQSLPERERLLLSLYYEQDLTLKEIGEVLDLTAARVCQLHTQAIHRLKAYLMDEAPLPKQKSASRKPVKSFGTSEIQAKSQTTATSKRTLKVTANSAEARHVERAPASEGFGVTQLESTTIPALLQASGMTTEIMTTEITTPEEETHVRRTL